ncbi:hypothetical protein [Parasediminibacterium sp. JCM 36343]|uniref:hypothetical protein n=1 Tax=Parasediminibacterium sp. JCM 36343 TaxID=3374279 RepID=UPI003977F308
MKKVVPGITEYIVHTEIGTPLTNEHYIRSTKGNVYGMEKGFFQTGLFSYTCKIWVKLQRGRPY